MDIPNVFVSVLLGIWLLILAIDDLRTFRISNISSLSLMASGFLFALWRSESNLVTHVYGAGMGYFALAIFGEAFFRLRGHEGLGLGDAKLFGATGAWLGWQALPTVLLLASVSGLIVALLSTRCSGRSAKIAFGPHIAAAFWLVWNLGAPGLPPVWR